MNREGNETEKDPGEMQLGISFKLHKDSAGEGRVGPTLGQHCEFRRTNTTYSLMHNAEDGRRRSDMKKASSYCGLWTPQQEDQPFIPVIMKSWEVSGNKIA